VPPEPGVEDARTEQRRPGGPLAALLANEKARVQLAKLYRFLRQPGEGPVVPGTRVPQQRVRQLLQFLDNRARDDSTRGSKVFGKLLAFLTREQPGAEMAAGANVQRFQTLLAALHRELGPSGENATDQMDIAESDDIDNPSSRGR
jgi:hypothetical protein